MQVDVQEFLKKAGLEEGLEKGERKIIKLRQAGEYKSHCVVYDWKTDPDKIRIEVKAGLSGKNLPPEELQKYPVGLQSPTYIELDVSAGGV